MWDFIPDFGLKLFSDINHMKFNCFSLKDQFTSIGMFPRISYITSSYLNSSCSAGNEIVAVDSPFGRLGLTVCYDLRFPELYQQLRFHHNAQVDFLYPLCMYS